MSDQPQQTGEIGGSVLGPVLRVLNDLVDGGFLKEYAIGGGIGVLYYIEPVLTYDFDVVCHFPGDRAKLALIAESHPNTYNDDVLKDILDRHRLLEKWNREYDTDTGD
jgi:hypothetical protein